jgi:glycosyltransferase involved in cell wall biosynthesis
MSGKISISIAMCTYNGARFLQEQLDSFLWQKRLPDELIVCDDDSRDETLSILNAFASKSPFPVKIYKNPQNIGYGKNFEKASLFCEGDIICFSDQDDIWLPHKLERVQEIFNEYSDLGYMVSDAKIVDEKLKPLGYSFWESIKISKKIQNKFIKGNALKLFFKDLEIYGNLLSFRSKFKEYVFPIPTYWSHDGWIPIILTIISKGFLIYEEHILYRQHNKQYCGRKKLNIKDQIKLAKITTKEDYIVRAKRWENALYCLKKDENIIDNNKVIGMVEGKITNLKARAQMGENLYKKIKNIFKEIISCRYFKYANGIKSIAKDIIYT